MNEYNKAKRLLWENLWIPIVVSAITLGLGIGLSHIRERIGWVPLLFVLLIVTLFFLLSLKVVISSIYPVSLGLLDRVGQQLLQIRQQLERCVDRSLITWMLTNEQLKTQESGFESPEVWIVSSNLAEETPGGRFFPVVQENLKRGVKYCYFIQKSLEAQARVKELESHQKYGAISFTYLPEDFFFLVPQLDFTIYDPMNRKGRKCGFMGLPVRDPGFYGEMDTEFLNKIIGKLETIPKVSPSAVPPTGSLPTTPGTPTQGSS